jgi:hypothetical protein
LFTFALSDSFSGTDASGTPLPDGSYILRCLGELWREKVQTGGSGNSGGQQKLIATTSVRSAGVEIYSAPIDTTPPVGFLLINADAQWTNSVHVALSLYYDDPESGVAAMCFSNDGVNYSQWEEPQASKAWELTIGDGTKTVWVQFKNAVGLVATSTDDIILDTVAPAAPAWPAAVGQSGKILLFWQANLEPDLYGYDIYRSETEAGPYAKITYTPFPPMWYPTYEDVDVVPGVAYYYVIVATDHAGNESGYSDEVSATASEPDVTPPAAPTGLGGVAGWKKATLWWTWGPEPDILGYHIYRSAGTLPPALSEFVRITPGWCPHSSNLYTDYNLDAGETYNYYVAAVDLSWNESAPSEFFSITLPAADITPPIITILYPAHNDGTVNRFPRIRVRVEDDLAGVECWGWPIGDRAIYLTPPPPRGCGLIKLANGAGST